MGVNSEPLRVVDIETGADRAFFVEPTPGWMYDGRVSPDGRRVAYFWTRGKATGGSSSRIAPGRTHARSPRAAAFRSRGARTARRSSPPRSAALTTCGERSRWTRLTLRPAW